MDEPLREVLLFYNLLDTLQISVLDALDLDERVEISLDIWRKFLKSLNEYEMNRYEWNEDHAVIPYINGIWYYADKEAEAGDENVILINI